MTKAKQAPAPPAWPSRRLARADEFLRCDRAVMGHSWDEISLPHDISLPGWGYPLTVRCTRCGTIRISIIDSRGELSTRRYIYPDGYQWDRDERPSSELLRLEALARSRYAPNGDDG